MPSHHPHTPPQKAAGVCPALLAGPGAEDFALVMPHLQEQVFPPHYCIFEDNAPGETLYIILSGQVRVSKRLTPGHECVLAELGPGEFFGEMALLEDKPRSARVTTLTATRVLALSRETFNRLIEQHPRVAVAFLRGISARLRQRNEERTLLLQEKQALVETLAAKNAELERALTELQAAMATVAEHERVKRDLEIAQQIQRQMLPLALPQLPTLHLHATTVPSRTVGGDFYDAIALDEHRIALLLGDVAGKGIAAAMQMARLMGELRACIRYSAAPEAVMCMLNTLLCQRNVPWHAFVTVQYLVLDLAQWTVTFICAGHPPLLLRRANGQVLRLGSAPNIPLGIEAGFRYRQETCRLVPGDLILLYSDGVYERRNPQGSTWGLEGLVQILATAPTHPAAAIDAVQAAATAFTGEDQHHDDTTMLCALVGGDT